jgi:hypothetical protein
MVLDGATAAEVAAAMNCGRNQALGRIWRDPDPEMRLRGIAGRSKSLKRKEPKPPVLKLVEIEEPIEELILDIPPPPPLPVKQAHRHNHPMPLIGTGRKWCKFPIKEDRDVLGGHLCCGEPVIAPGAVYCIEHTRKASGRFQ